MNDADAPPPGGLPGRGRPVTGGGAPPAGGGYPTWQQVSPALWRTVEEHDGVPDFWLVRVTTPEGDRGWRLQWRTSPMAAWYSTAESARWSVDQALAWQAACDCGHPGDHRTCCVSLTKEPT